MQILKALGFFLLLLSGSSGLAFSSESGEDCVEENALAADLSEDTPELSYSTLANLTSFEPGRINYGTDYYFFHSLHETREANKYLFFSGLLTPSPGIRKIIFPFQTFL